MGRGAGEKTEILGVGKEGLSAPSRCLSKTLKSLSEDAGAPVAARRNPSSGQKERGAVSCAPSSIPTDLSVRTTRRVVPNSTRPR